MNRYNKIQSRYLNKLGITPTEEFFNKSNIKSKTAAAASKALGRFGALGMAAALPQSAAGMGPEEKKKFYQEVATGTAAGLAGIPGLATYFTLAPTMANAEEAEMEKTFGSIGNALEAYSLSDELADFQLSARKDQQLADWKAKGYKEGGRVKLNPANYIEHYSDGTKLYKYKSFIRDNFRRIS